MNLSMIAGLVNYKHMTYYYIDVALLSHGSQLVKCCTNVAAAGALNK